MDSVQCGLKNPANHTKNVCFDVILNACCVFKYVVDSGIFYLKSLFLENCRWINVSLNICLGKPWLKQLIFSRD